MNEELIQLPLTRREAHVMANLIAIGTAVLNAVQLSRRGEADKATKMIVAGDRARASAEAQMDAGVFDWEDSRSGVRKLERLVSAAWPDMKMVHDGNPNR